MIKTVSRGPLTAKLSQLQKGQHAGKWKITYLDSSGKMTTAGIIKDEKKARKIAEDALDGILKTKLTLTEREAALIADLRASGIAPDDLRPFVEGLRSVNRALIRDAVDQFLSREVNDAGYSLEQRRDYKTVLSELKDRFGSDQVSSVTIAKLEAWTDGWNVGPKRFNNKRTILSAFWSWSTAREFCRKNIAADLKPKRVPRKASHEVLTPAEFATLLVHCPDLYIPWLALSGFAGLRGIEIYGRPDDRASGLHWEHIDWDRKTILLGAASVKQTRSSRARLIEMPDALIDWLSPWRKATGPVHPPSARLPTGGTGSVSSMLGKLIGGWKNNALRASRASYRLAETQSITIVTLEMGHTKDMLLGTYLNPRFAEDAATWFALDRQAAKALAESQSVVPISAKTA